MLAAREPVGEELEDNSWQRHAADHVPGERSRGSMKSATPRVPREVPERPKADA